MNWWSLLILLILPAGFFGGKIMLARLKRRRANQAFLGAINPTLKRCQRAGISAIEYQEEFERHKAAAQKFSESLKTGQRQSFLVALHGYETWFQAAKSRAQSEADYSMHDIGIVQVKKINPSVHLKKLVQFAL